jgi:hypothetical protein
MPGMAPVWQGDFGRGLSLFHAQQNTLEALSRKQCDITVGGPEVMSG